MANPKKTDQEIILFIYKISRLVRKHTVDASHIAEEPTMLQLQTLMNLSHGAVTMGHIAQELYIKLPTASSLVDRLIEAGYIKRISDKLDRRITKIDLTEKGKQILTITMKAKMKKMEFILNILSTGEKKSIVSIMKNLHKKLEIQTSLIL
jgi:DNA-binding MarR family transcriptional regulator